MTSRIEENTPERDTANGRDENSTQARRSGGRRSDDKTNRKQRREARSSQSKGGGRVSASPPASVSADTAKRSRFARTATSRAKTPNAPISDDQRTFTPVDAQQTDFTAAAPVRKRKDAPPSRGTSRGPAIWRGDTNAAGERAASGQHVEGRGRIRWRFFSGFIALAMIGAMAYLFVDDSFYVQADNFVIGGIRMMTRDEVMALTNVRDMHVFWIDPALVRADLLNSATIADAQVDIGWSPNMVQIMVQEREPVFLWESGEQRVWIDLQGRVMQVRGERELPRIVADIPIPVQDRIDIDIVNAVLQLQQLRPDITTLRYNVAEGIGYDDARGWTAWFGVGTDIPEKILIYNAIVDDLQGREITPREINLVNPDAPYRR